MRLLDHAYQFLGIEEFPGQKHHPWIVWAHSLCGLEAPDETAWCSSAMNAWAYGCGLERTRSARARSWLKVGDRVPVMEARPGNDIVILKRGDGVQPGPDVIDAPGHVGVFVGWMNSRVLLLGGNQSNAVTIAQFPYDRILDVRRLRA